MKTTELDPLVSPDDADVIPIADVSESATKKLSIGDLKAAIGGGGGDASTWSQYPATQDVDMDGHDVVGLPAYSLSSPPADQSAAASFVTLVYAILEAVSAWATAPASQDVDMDGHKITGLGAPTDAADAATKQYVDTAVSSAVPTKIENGTSKVETLPNGDIEIWHGGTKVAEVAMMGSPSEPVFRLLAPHPSYPGHFYVRPGGDASLSVGGGWSGFTFAYSGDSILRSHNGNFPITSNGYRAMPSGVSSIVHGVHLAKSAADGLASRDPVAWTPSWTGSLNVDSVSHVEASVQEIGDYIDVEGSLTVTPDAAGVTVVTASIGVAFAHPAVDKDGQGSAGVAGVSVQSAGCRVSTDGTVSVAFDAASNAEHTVSFRCRYRKVTP